MLVGLARLADAARLPLWHEAKAMTRRGLITRQELWRDPPLDAAGLPVLLVGGVGSTALLLGPLQDLLHRLNCRVLVAPVRLGIGCGETVTGAVERALVRLTDATSQPAVIIGHSRGGQFGRAVAVRRPELVRGLITLGSPLTRLLAVHPMLRAQLVLLGMAGAVGVPGLLRPGCLWGSCCARLRGDVGGPFPESVRFLSVYSRLDTIVDWRSSQDPAARHAEVAVSHGGLIWEPDSLAAITGELAATLAVTADPPALRSVHTGPFRRQDGSAGHAVPVNDSPAA